MNSDPRLTEPQVPVEPDQASRLLRVGLRGPARPVDRLLDRLAEPDGATWLDGVLSEGPLAVLVEPAPSDLTPDHLRALKEMGKTAAMRADTRDATLRAMVGYFFSIAAGLAQFGQNISSRSAEELDPILMDLAAVSPSGWSAIFERAWSALGSDD